MRICERETADLDPDTGAVRVLARLPAAGADLAVAGDHVLVSHGFGREVWAVHRRTGGLVATIPTGRGPLGIAAEW